MARDPYNRQDRDWRDYHHPAMSYQVPKQLRRFRAAMTLLVSTALVAGLWTGLWFAASGYVQAKVADLISAQAGRAADLGYDAMEVSGFPSRIVLSFSNPRYLGLLSGRTVTWRGETLTLTTRPWLPWHLHVDAPGRHDIKTADGRLGVSGEVARLGIDLVAGDGWPERLGLDLQGLNFSGSTDVSVDSLMLDLTHDASVKAGGDGLTLALSGSAITLPLGGGWGVGDTLENVDIALTVNGPVRIGPLAGPLAERLAQWRDVGGAVQFERLKLRAGPLALAAAGTVALDPDLQPVGAFSAKFEGLFQVLEILRTQGLIRDGDAVLATMALAALSKRSPDGGPPSINLAVSVQDRKLSLGTIPILELPILDWGLAPAADAPQAEQPPQRDYKDVPTIY